MLTILFILLVLALVGGGFGHSRYGYAGWSPAGILVVILLVMFFTAIGSSGVLITDAERPVGRSA